MNESFYVSTKHKTLAFSAAHFICHDEWREFIHGHNYRVGLSLEASKIDSKTGYIVDFKDIEAPLKEIVENFKGKLIVPTLSKSLTHSDDGTSITLIHGKSKFMLPIEDCYLVDVEYSSVEELSKWIALKFVEKAGKENLINQHIKSIRLDMYETEDRMASYFYKLE